MAYRSIRENTLALNDLKSCLETYLLRIVFGVRPWFLNIQFNVALVQWLLLSTTRQIYIWKNVFSNLMQHPFCIFFFFFFSFFIVMNVDLKIFVKTHVLLYFYNETRSSHQRYSTKAVLENFAIFTRKLCWSLFLVKLQCFSPAILLKRGSSTGVILWVLQNI